MTAFVLGNGQSRAAIDPNVLSAIGPVYGCNALYRTYAPQVLVATDTAIARAIQESGYALRNRFHTRRPLEGHGAQPIPKSYQGFSSGPVAVALAALDQHDPIYLLGFDLGGLPGDRFNNIYADTEFYKPSHAPSTYSGNWIRQIMKIAGDFPRQKFLRIMGDQTALVPEFDKIPNLLKCDLPEFLARINTAKDL